VPEPSDKKPPTIITTIERFRKAWGQLTFMATVLISIGGGFLWVNSRIDEYQQRGVDLTELKRASNELRQEQRAINARLAEAVEEIQEAARAQFDRRENQHRELSSRISAVLTEMRARHGELPLADAPNRRTQIRRSVRATDEVYAAEPEALPAPELAADLTDLR
jgi:predicted glycosyl hydrolase (DUF1957 family)